MSILAYFGLPLDVQIMLAVLVLVLLLGPVASVLRNPSKYLRIGAYVAIGLIAAYGVPQIVDRFEPVLGEFAPWHGLLVVALWLAVRNIVRLARGGSI